MDKLHILCNNNLIITITINPINIMNLTPLEYINTLSKSGTVAPSSKFLIKKCLKNIDFKEAKVIVEFGMGEGCITGEILKKCAKDTLLLSFEINPKFYDYCQGKFKDYSNFKPYNESAFEFKKCLNELGIEKVDYFISSLPIALLDKQKAEALFQEAKTILSTNGQLIQYQYSLNNRRLINSVFPKVTMDFTFLNLPPAFIYHCS